MAQIEAFFEHLSRRLPADDLSDFQAVVAEDVEVWRDGEKLFDNREAWFDYLSPERPPHDASDISPIGYNVVRSEFYRNPRNEILVREFVSPIAPEGRQIVYHPGYAVRFVTYLLEDGLLKKVDYGSAYTDMPIPRAFRD